MQTSLQYSFLTLSDVSDTGVMAEVSHTADGPGHFSDESWEQPVETNDKQADQYPGRSRRSAKDDTSCRTSSSSSNASSEESDQNGPIGESASTIEVFRNRFEDWTTSKPRKTNTLQIPRDRAIIIRHHELDNGPWEMHSTTVRSPFIRKVLAKAFENYPGIDAKLEDMTFRAPFHELFFRWSKFLELLEGETDEKVLEHCNLLIDTMKEILQPQIERASDLKKCGLVEFDYLWTLFEPGTEVYAKIDDHHRLFIVDDSFTINGKYERKKFQVNCRFVDFDGSKLGFDTSKREIDVFRGVKPVTDLPFYPSDAHNNIVQIRRQLDVQGRKILAHCGVHFVQYTGFALEYDHSYFNPDQKPNAKWVSLEALRPCVHTLSSEAREGDSQWYNAADITQIDNQRIVLDAKSWTQQNVAQAPCLDPISSAVRTRSRSDSISPSRGFARLPSPQANAELEMPSQDEPDLDIPSNLVKYCAPFVRGFNLKTKNWIACFISSVERIEWNDGAFEKLLLRQQYKDMILAFMQSHTQCKDQFDDIIKGKGQGFVMLLEGVAGVGKTLTAESIAEKMHQPLYSLSAGELGAKTETVDMALQRVLDFCAKWHAVLLIDECDVSRVLGERLLQTTALCPL